MEPTLEELKNDVVQILVTQYDCLSEEAETLVEESVVKDEGMWLVNASAEDIAKYLAPDDEEE
jgi:hypothetical protein